MEQKKISGYGWVLTEAILIVLVVLTALLGIASLSRTSRHSAPQRLNPLSQGWYLLRDGERVAVETGDRLTFGADGKLTVYHSSLPSSYRRSTLTTDAALYRVRICLGDEILYAFDDSAFPCNDQMRSKIHCDATLPADAGEATLSITYTSSGSETFVFPAVRIGSSGDVLLDHIASESFTLFIVAAMLLIGIATAVVCVYLALVGMMDRRFLDVAAFLILCSVWSLCDSGLARYLSHMSAGVEGLSFYAFMTLAIPMIHFIYATGNMRRYRSIYVVTMLFYLNVIIQTVLWLTGTVSFIDMLPVTHLLLAGGIIFLIFTMHREYSQTHDRQLRAILFAFGLVSMGGVLALILYWLFGISFYGEIFELGILAFIAVLFVILMVEVVENFRFRAEAKIYERLSREDAMTGLLNRRGFDEWMQSYILSRAEGENAALLFLDINGLKAVNDQLGHKAGDELVIGAAGCLRETFGDMGIVSRLGGDEFCVVLPATDDRYTQWREKLDTVITRYNLTHRVVVSLASGYSMLLEENGVVKNQSDWKQQADQMMYENKKLMKSIRIC